MVVPCESIDRGVGSARACWPEGGVLEFSASASAAAQEAERLGGPLSETPICVEQVNVLVGWTMVRAVGSVSCLGQEFEFNE